MRRRAGEGNDARYGGIGGRTDVHIGIAGMAACLAKKVSDDGFRELESGGWKRRAGGKVRREESSLREQH